MRVSRLKLANLRAIEAAEFTFRPGCNLVVGVNGVGKTSVLDSLAVCLSAVVRDINRLRTPTESFALDDIRIGADVLMVECDFTIGQAQHNYLIHKPRATSTPQEKKAGMPREQVHETPERMGYVGDQPKPATGNELLGR